MLTDIDGQPVKVGDVLVSVRVPGNRICVAEIRGTVAVCDPVGPLEARLGGPDRFYVPSMALGVNWRLVVPFSRDPEGSASSRDPAQRRTAMLSDHEAKELAEWEQWYRTTPKQVMGVMAIDLARKIVTLEGRKGDHTLAIIQAATERVRRDGRRRQGFTRSASSRDPNRSVRS